MKPLVSVCIPNYNGEKFLRESLDSALSQTYRDIEVLVVDNHSSDGSVGVAAMYAARDHRVRVVRNEKNVGPVGNFNRCVSHARGEWIKFLFHDDTLEPACIEKMVEAGGHGKPVVVCDRDIIFDSESRSQKDLHDFISCNNMNTTFPGMTSVEPDCFSEALLGKWMVNFVGEPVAVLLHRSLFPRFGMFSDQLIQLVDLEFWARVACNEGLAYVPEKLASYRLHDQSGTAVNHASRKFRLMIDEVVCCHHYAFHPSFARLRACASRQRPPIDLEQVLASKLKALRKIAGDDPASDGSRQLQELYSAYPILKEVRKIPFSFTFIRWKWKALELLGRPQPAWPPGRIFCNGPDETKE